MDQLDQLDHYEILGVRRSATAEEIKRAYRQQMTRYHPDRYAGASPEEQAEVGRRAQRINEAYAALSDFATRTAYNRALPPDGRAAAGRSTATPPPAQPRDHLAELYEQARAHLDAGRNLQAAATLREIQAISPFYRDSAALLEQAELAARPGSAQRPASPPVARAEPAPDRGRRALLLGGLGGLLLAGGGAAFWALRRQSAGGVSAGPAAGGAAPTLAPAAPATAAPPTAVPTSEPTVPPTTAPTSEPTVPPTPAPPTTAPPTVAPTVAPTATPAALAEEGELVYGTDFTRGAGWPSIAGNGWSVGFTTGAYQITAREGVGNIWAFNTSLAGPDFQVGVDVEVTGGVAGLMLRYSDRSYLAYYVDAAAGVYRLEQWGGGRGTVLAAEAHPAVALGPGARNRLLARLEGERVALRVNGVPVADLDIANPPPTARYGMLALATSAEVVALFRNLAVRAL